MTSRLYAWAYPGQGSQTPGMGRKLVAEFPLANDVFKAASELSGYNLDQIRQKGPSELLARPDVAEPLLAATQIAYTNVMLSAGLEPTWVAGYSAGEVAAFYAAGVLSERDAIRCAAIRGRVLTRYTTDAAKMIAVSRLAQHEILDNCKPNIEVAAWNAPDALTLVGPTDCISEAASKLTSLGGSVQHVDVHGPWHSEQVQPASEEIYHQLEDIQFEPPKRTCLLSLSGKPESDPQALRRGLAQQVARPVRWQTSLDQLWRKGARNVVELGAGRVLMGYIRRNWTEFQSYTVQCVETSSGGIQPLKRLISTTAKGNY